MYFVHPFMPSPCFVPRYRANCAPVFTRGGCGVFNLLGGFADALVLVMFVSMFFPLLLSLVGFVLHVAFNVFIAYTVVSAMRRLIEGMCSSDQMDRTCIFRTCSGESGKKRGEKSEAGAEKTVETGDDKKPAATTAVRDLSAMRVEVSDDQVEIHLGAPGVRPADLSVKVLDDHVLSVKGETKKGHALYRVDRRIELPFIADPDQLTASHADGELTLVVKRLVRSVAIPVSTVEPPSLGRTVAQPAASASSDSAGHPSAASEAKDDEWVPLPKEDECAD